MAEGKLNRRTPWAAQSPDLWSNRQLFRLSRSHAACGFSAAQVIPPGDSPVYSKVVVVYVGMSPPAPPRVRRRWRSHYHGRA